CAFKSRLSEEDFLCHEPGQSLRRVLTTRFGSDLLVLLPPTFVALSCGFDTVVGGGAVCCSLTSASLGRTASGGALGFRGGFRRNVADKPMATAIAAAHAIHRRDLGASARPCCSRVSSRACRNSSADENRFAGCFSSDRKSA